ncbi:Sodium channel protein 60E [Diplonema papillatum]|nr:Sodium channel protein 60E [Diplonema papillatum]
MARLGAIDGGREVSKEMNTLAAYATEDDITLGGVQTHPSMAERRRRRSSVAERLGSWAGTFVRLENATVTPSGYSFFLFAPDNRFRTFLVRVCNSTVFQGFIIMVVISNAASMAVTNPAYSIGEKESDTWQACLYYFDMSCLALYVVEIAMKMIAMGAFVGENSFWRDKWNKLDLVVVILGWFGWIGSRLGYEGPTRGANALRVFRAIKPFRVVKALPGVRAILDALSLSIPLLASTTCLFFFFFFTFAIVALEFYQESLNRRCVVVGGVNNSTDLASLSDSVLLPYSPADDETIPYTWCNVEKDFGNKCPPEQRCAYRPAPYYNAASFDDVGSAALIMWQVLTLDSWSFYLYALGSAEHWLWTLFFFVAAIVLISFVVINLFLAVIHSVFSEVRQQHHHSAFIDTPPAEDEAQKREDIIDAFDEQATQDACPIPPLHKLQGPVTRLLHSKAFVVFINAAIILNVIVQTYETSGHRSVQEYASVSKKIEYAFTAIFGAEILLRMIRFGTIYSFFAKDAWNTFDLLIVIISILALSTGSTSLAFFRALRLLRVLLLLRQFEGLQRLLQAAVAGVLPTVNVLLFALFTLFVFSCMGMALFGGFYDRHNDPEFAVQADSNVESWISTVERLNFDSFQNAFILLFQVMTGDSWSVWMWYSMNIDVRVPWLQAVVFFILYYFCAGLILLSLFTVVILENFELTKEEKTMAAQRLRKNIDQTSETIIAFRKGMGLSVSQYWGKRKGNDAAGAAPARPQLSEVVKKIRNRVGSVRALLSHVTMRKSRPPTNLLPLVMFSNRLCNSTAPSINDDDLDELTVAAVNPHMFEWVCKAYSLAAEAMNKRWGRFMAIVNKSIISCCREERYNEMMRCLENELSDALGVGISKVASVIEGRLFEDPENPLAGGPSTLVVTGLFTDVKGRTFAPSVSDPRTLECFEVCLAENYERNRLVLRDDSARREMWYALKKTWSPNDVAACKIQAAMLTFLTLKNHLAPLTFQRQERFDRELIVDDQHQAWHALVACGQPDGIVRLPPLRCLERRCMSVALRQADDSIQQQRAARQRFYSAMIVYKTKYTIAGPAADIRFDVEAVAKTYDIDSLLPPDMTFRNALRQILNGNFVLACHSFKSMAKGRTLQKSFRKTRRLAKNMLHITSLTFQDIYLRQAFQLAVETNPFLLDREPTGERSSSCAGLESLTSSTQANTYVHEPPLLLSPIDTELHDEGLEEEADDEAGGRSWKVPSIAEMCGGYCGYCTAYRARYPGALPKEGFDLLIRDVSAARVAPLLREAAMRAASPAMGHHDRGPSRVDYASKLALRPRRDRSPPAPRRAFSSASPRPGPLFSSLISTSLEKRDAVRPVSPVASSSGGPDTFLTSFVTSLRSPRKIGDADVRALSSDFLAPGGLVVKNLSPDSGRRGSWDRASTGGSIPNINGSSVSPAASKGLVTFKTHNNADIFGAQLKSPAASPRMSPQTIPGVVDQAGGKRPIESRRRSLNHMRGGTVDTLLSHISGGSFHHKPLHPDPKLSNSSGLLPPVDTVKAISEGSTDDDMTPPKRTLKSPFVFPTTTVSRTASLAVLRPSADIEPDDEDNESEPRDPKSFGLFRSNHPFRLQCTIIATSFAFQLFVLVLVITSSLTVVFLPISNAWDRYPDQPSWVLPSEIVFIALFTAEAIVKSTSKTFYAAGDASYIASYWNRLDCLVLFCQVVALFFPTVKFLRLTRALRPLRLVSQIGGLQVVLNALVASIGTLINVSIAGSFFIFLFALLGYHLFHGRFNRCTNPAWSGWEHKSDCVGETETSVDGIVYLVPVAWIKPVSTFDTIHAAMATCLEISSLSGWSNHAYNSMDITDHDRQPKLNNSQWAILYYILAITVCCFFLVNLFIGVIITNINTYRGIEIMDQRQQEWMFLQRTVSIVRPPIPNRRPSGKLRELCYDISNNKFFTRFIFVVIALNIIVLAAKHRSAPSEFVDVSEGLNYGFLAIYTVEMVILIAAHGMNYFRDPWNRFDFIIVWGSLLSVLVQLTSGGMNLAVISVARIFRVGRVFRLAKRFKGVSTMFQTLLVSLPQILNISLVLLILVFIYTVVGMNFFSHVRFQYHLNRSANFRTFSSALSIVFRMVTLDDWNRIMRDCTITEPECTYSDNFDDCGSRWAFLYFFSFYIIGSYIFLNLVIAVILDNFTHTFNEAKQSITDDDVQVFTSVWTKYDTSGAGSISSYAYYLQLRYPLSHPFSAVQDRIQQRVLPNTDVSVIFASTHVFQRTHLPPGVPGGEASS